MMASAPPNIRLAPYDHPGFAPIGDELTGVPLRISGTVPAGLDGVFLRNGANALFPGPRPHMFDGEAMLHMVELRGGEAHYSNCLVRTPRTDYIERRGRNPFLGVGDLAGGGKAALVRLLLQQLTGRLGLIRVFAPIESVAASTSVLHFDHKLFCLQETGLPFALDVERDADGWLRLPGSGHLERFGDSLASPFSAHPKLDPATGEAHSIGHDIMSGTTAYTRIAPGGAARTATITTEKPPAFFVHDFIVTERFVIFPDTSLRFDPAGLAKPGGSIATFDPAHPLRFGVIDREHRTGDRVRWFTTSGPGHIWHIANGWEDGERIVIHAPVFADYPATVPIHTPAEPHARFTRWALDLATGDVVEERALIDGFYERPGIDMRQAGRRSRFAWLLDESGGVMGRGVLKYDLIDERAAGAIDYGQLHGGEPLFVPRDPSGTVDEDSADGWLLDMLADGERADLIVIDAATMTEQCRIHMPRRVPFGVHGLWLDRSEVDALRSDALME